MSPLRTCAGCGRTAEKADLIRFSAHEGVLTPSEDGPGRGVYTCPHAHCFERARRARAFTRMLRRNVRVEPELARLYTSP